MTKANKVVVGYVVKRERMEEKPDPKRAGNVIRFKVRTEVSRVYHSIDAARVFLGMIKKSEPDGEFYIHEKRKSTATHGAIA